MEILDKIKHFFSNIYKQLYYLYSLIILFKKEQPKLYDITSLTVLYLIVSYIFIYIYPITNYTYFSNSFLIITLFYSLIVIMYGFMNFFQGTNEAQKQLKVAREYIYLFLFLLAIILLITYIFTHVSSVADLVNFIIYSIIIISFSYLIYKYILKKYFIGENNIFVKLVNDISSSIKNITSSSVPSYIYKLIMVELVVIVMYFSFPYLQYKYFTYKGKQILNKPINLNKKVTHTTHHELTQSDNFDYHYTISLWAFFNQTPSTVNKYNTIFNYGNKPLILFNPMERKVKIMMLQGKDNLVEIYKGKVELQKWNNIVVTYDRGNVDIFINGKLVATEENIVPFMSYETLETGYQDDLEKENIGGIGNIMYYPNVFSYSNIQENYKLLRNKPYL